MTTDTRYRVLLADPPWRFNDKLPGPGRGADKHYQTIETDGGITSFAIPEMADDSVLFMWRVSAMVEDAYRVVRAWGFVPKTEIVWRKQTKNNKRHFGMGRIVRAEHETCIIATRGSPKVKNHNTRSVFDAVAVKKHSKKPAEFYDIIESLFDGPYVELFARNKRIGWDSFGNELTTTKEEQDEDR